jgi:hypothetical protein
VLTTFLVVFVDSFRNAYVRTGMNLTQSLVMFAVDLARRGWLTLWKRGA